MPIPLSLNSELRPVTANGEHMVAAVADHHDFLAEQARATDAEGRFARESVEALVDAGVFAAPAPVELGGSGVERLRDLTVIMETALTAARGTLGAGLRDFDAHLLLNRPRSVTAETGRAMMKECQTVSLVVGRAAREVVDHAMTLTGGASCTAGHPLARVYRDVRAAPFMPPYSPPEEAVDFLADTTLGEPPPPRADGTSLPVRRTA
ncbi:acyl-CoA dehydrogenase family protein [Streptomyces jumonjinensis]|uniref:acyl-CoA dehydrogenase family protein n=1 Tax=Streptomyces jumonjinensis TaxID=1945 RepID=UPI0037BA3ABB